MSQLNTYNVACSGQQYVITHRDMLICYAAAYWKPVDQGAKVLTKVAALQPKIVLSSSVLLLSRTDASDASDVSQAHLISHPPLYTSILSMESAHCGRNTCALW
eukprot:scpid32501/ scgid8866/ 